MKRLVFTVTAAALLTLALLVAFQLASPNMRRFAYAERDWNRDLALMGNDLPVLLKYNPTDGASYAVTVKSQPMSPNPSQSRRARQPHPPQRRLLRPRDFILP